MMKKRVLSLILVVILSLGFVTTAYGNEITDMYNMLFIEYTISGTIIEKDSYGIYIELDKPISHAMSISDIKYGFIEGSSNLSIGDKFNPTSKYQILDVLSDGFIVIGVFTPSIGSITVTEPVEEEYVSDDWTQYTLDWLDEAIAANKEPVVKEPVVQTPVVEEPEFLDAVYHNEVLIDAAGEIEQGMDVSLLRLYVDNTVYMTIGMEPPVYNETTGQWIYSPMQKIIKNFNHSGKTILEKAFYENGFSYKVNDRGNGCTSIDIILEVAG